MQHLNNSDSYANGGLQHMLLSTTVLMTMRNESAAVTAAAAAGRPAMLSTEDKLLIVNIRLIVYAYLVLPLAIVGIALNGFTIIVLLHPRMRYFSTNAYLTALSIANMVCLLNFTCLYSLRYLLSNEIFKKNVYQPDGAGVDEIHPYESFINLIMGLWSPIFTTFQLCAIYLTCAVTVDRWIYLTWPLKVDTICTMRTTLRAIALIFICCALYNVPKWFEIESVRVLSSNTQRVYYQAKQTAFGRHPMYDKIMRKYCYMVFVYGVPFFVLLIVNIGIIRKLIEAKRRKSKLLGGSSRKQQQPNKNNPPVTAATFANAAANVNTTTTNNNNNNNNSNNNTTTGRGQSLPGAGGGSVVKESRSPSSVNPNASVNANANAKEKASTKLDPRVTLMVLAVVLAFFCSQFPYLLIHLLTGYQQQLWFHIAKCCCDLLSVINYCINFLIYCFFGQNFRQIASQMLCNPSLSPYRHTARRHTSAAANAAKSNMRDAKAFKAESAAKEAKAAARAAGGAGGGVSHCADEPQELSVVVPLLDGADDGAPVKQSSTTTFGGGK